MIDDNFHYLDEGYRYQYGVFETEAEAVAIARRSWMSSSPRTTSRA